MAPMKGREQVRQYFASLPDKLETKILRGAAKAGGSVIKDEAKLRTQSDQVRDDLRMRTRAKDGKVRVTIDVKPGFGRSIANWEEYGTDPHFIRVADEQRQGLSVRKVNERTKDGSLVINGNFVSGTVFHPGAAAHPFLRPSLDLKGAEAIAEAQGYINAKLASTGLNGPDIPVDEE
ncbi:HK97 gp10 family phage protein [Qipengyuania atrilutea]|nr:HK97 gp10 family phage protein [Actirhodobacter atriluteus]